MEQGEKLSERLERFARQHYDLYGDFIGEDSAKKRSGGEAVSSGSQRTESEQEAGEVMAKGSQQLFEHSESESFAWFRSEIRGIQEEWVSAESLDTFAQMIKDCQKCPLWETRQKLVFGTGDPNADIMVIGEAPGADEDRIGEPFVGAAGKLLTKILEAINLSRDDVYICNIVKSRPPGNRRPEQNEVASCIPYLYKQIDLVRPKFILALGLTAAKSLLGTTEPMKALRGKIQDWHGISVLITYHPAALLRNPNWKRPVWEDVQLLRKLYDESVDA